MTLIAALTAAALIFAPTESEAAKAAGSAGGTDSGTLLELASKLFRD